MNKGLDAFEEIFFAIRFVDRTPGASFNMDKIEENLETIENELKALELIRKCFYVGNSGAIAKTDYGFEHEEELKEALYEKKQKNE